MNEDTGIGSPMNVVVGPSCSVMMVLYLLSLSIPQHKRRIDAIIMMGCWYNSNMIIAGAIPNEITSANESMVSPNMSLVEVGNFLANGPSIASKNTARSNSSAVYVGCW